MDDKFKLISLATDQSSPLYRYFRVKRDDASDDGTFQVRMSSEFPGEQRAGEDEEKLGIAKVGEKYIEILSHEKNDVDISRFIGENRAPLLDEHKDNRHLGYIKTAALSDDKSLRGVIVFDKASKLSKTRCAEVLADSRVNFSLGYVHTGYLGPQTLDGGKVGHRFSFRAVELSNVACPLDPTAQKGRSGSKDCHCIRCGDIYDRSKLDDNFMCPDCAAAEEPEENGIRNETIRMFRKKTEDGKEEKISHSEMRNAVEQAADSDKRFKRERENGDKYSDYRVHDIHQVRGEDGEDDEMRAIIQSPAWSGPYYEVDFDYEDGEATLGESRAVEPKLTFEAIDRGLSSDMRMIRSDDKPYGNVTYADPGYQEDGKHRYPVDTEEHAKAAWSYINQEKNAEKYSAADLAKVKSRIKAACKKFGIDVDEKRSLPVDSQKSLNARTAPEQNLDNKIMLKTAAELAAEAPEAVAQLRAETERTTRAAVVAENNTNAQKVEEANKEVRALADAAMKGYGQMWNGPKGEVIVVGAEIRKLEAEICRRDHTHDAVERRTDFKRALDKLTTGAYPAKDPAQAAFLPDELASRCSLRALYNRAAREQAAGRCSEAFMPKDGSEFESDKEMRSQAQNFPGGFGHATQGVLLPANMPCKAPHQIGRSFRGQAGRMQRDALASDFATAGALIAPEYRFPSIELLYNFMALSKAGITMISGVMGSPIVMPRMTSGTVSQSVAEGVILNEYDQTFDQVKFEPHRLGSKQIWSRLAMLQVGEDFEAVVINDHMRINALRFDYLLLNGQGAGDEPLGLMNQPGIGVVTFGGSASSAYKNCVALETAIRKANIDEPPTFITTSVVRGTLRVTPATLTGSTVVSGATNAIWTDDEVIERPATDSQQVPNDALVCLVGRHVVGMQWGGWQTVIDTITLADSDKIRLSINTYVDGNLRHPQAVSRSADALTTLS